MNKARYSVRILLSGKSYSAFVPDLPGCVAAGATVEKVHTLIAKAVATHLELMRESGEAIPSPANPVDLDLDDLEPGELCAWVEIEMPETSPV